LTALTVNISNNKLCIAECAAEFIGITLL
jgi:hypothetical protein